MVVGDTYSTSQRGAQLSRIVPPQGAGVKENRKNSWSEPLGSFDLFMLRSVAARVFSAANSLLALGDLVWVEGQFSSVPSLPAGYRSLRRL